MSLEKSIDALTIEIRLLNSNLVTLNGPALTDKQKAAVAGKAAAAGKVATAATGKATPAKATPAKTTAAAAKGPKKLDRDAANKLVLKLVGADHRDEVVALLNKFKAKKASQVSDAHFPKFAAALQALEAQFEEAAEDDDDLTEAAADVDDDPLADVDEEVDDLADLEE